MIIGIDADGSIWTHDYPRIGKDIGAAPVLKKLVEQGHQLMLWTMRGNKPGNSTLADAVKWFADNEIPLWGINENPDQTKSGWSNSHKQHANYYIDDAAIGCPLIYDIEFHDRPFIDWVEMERLLIEKGILKQ